MIIFPQETDSRVVYQALIGMVTPRPIAWVTSVDLEGRVNLAPFSFFNLVSGNPPVVIFAPALNRDGSKKDTLRNIEETGEFVINAAVESFAEAMNLTSAELPHGQSEAELAGLTLMPSTRIRVPGVKESPAQLECQLMQVIPLGENPSAGTIVIGSIVAIRVDDSVLDDSGRIDPRKLQTIGRLGRTDYCRTTDLFEMVRPTS